MKLENEIHELKEEMKIAKRKRDRYEAEKGIKSDEYKEAKEEVQRVSGLLHDANSTYNILLSQQQLRQQPPSEGNPLSFLLFAPSVPFPFPLQVCREWP